MASAMNFAFWVLFFAANAALIAQKVMGLI